MYSAVENCTYRKQITKVSFERTVSLYPVRYCTVSAASNNSTMNDRTLQTSSGIDASKIFGNAFSHLQYQHTTLFTHVAKQHSFVLIMLNHTTAMASFMVLLATLFLASEVAAAGRKSSSKFDCNRRPPENSTFVPGQCCEYGWRTDVADPYPDLYDPSRTEAFGKISCLQWVFPVHLFFTFSIVILGLIAMVLRLDCLKAHRWLHPWCGRFTIISLMGAMFSALLIHNEGLPIGVIVNFTVALVCIAVAWIAIVIQEQRWHEAGLTRAVNNSKTEEYQQQAKIHWSGMTYREKFFSLVTLHGTLMFTGWFQFFGRFFYLIVLGSSYGHHYVNVGGSFSFTCYTYPMYKQKQVSNYIFCNDTQTNKAWNACNKEGYCPVHVENTNVMPWDPEDLGILNWVLLLVVVPFLISLFVFWKWVPRNNRGASQHED